jgi:hypothetical protein
LYLIVLLFVLLGRFEALLFREWYAVGNLMYGSLSEIGLCYRREGGGKGRRDVLVCIDCFNSLYRSGTNRLEDREGLL